MESLCGITQFLTDSTGFEAIIKQRYSDFCVHEISVAEETLRLQPGSLEPCAVEAPESSVETADNLTGSTSDPDPDCPDCLSGHDQGLESVVSGSTKSYVIQLGESNSKEKRANVHKAIRERYPDLESNTVEKDGAKYIEVANVKLHMRKRKFWPQDRGDYCHFVLYKENVDTHKAVSLLARSMHVPETKLTVAGNKDKRGITSQAVSVYRTESDVIEKACGKLTNIRVGNFQYKKTGLQLGDLFGNRFTIVLRNIASSVETVSNCVQAWQENGFINYFGLQRFGTQEVATWEIGKALVRSDWQQAIDLILAVPEGDSELKTALRIWRATKVAHKAMAAVPGRLKKVSIEANLLQGLKSKSDNDLVGALHYIPRNSRLLYLHSFQSYLWNCIVSERLKLYGHQVLAGDLILADSGSADDIATVANGDSEPAMFSKVVEVTDADLSDQSKGLHYTQVVLPLPGHAVRLPNNDTKYLYEKVLTEHSLKLADFDSQVKDYALKGDYRHPFMKPLDVEFAFFHYNDPFISLIRSDLEVLKDSPEPVSVEGGKFLALRIGFTLPSSCYATMAIRELNKTDTSFAKQMELNDKYVKESRNLTVNDTKTVVDDSGVCDVPKSIESADKIESEDKFESEDKLKVGVVEENGNETTADVAAS